METLSDKLALIGRHIDRATTVLDADTTASPVLRAVVGEFARKHQKASTALGGASEQVARELVVELEQAGDSANVAAKADMGASADSRKAVDVAHNSICVLKFETKPA
jgi:hypothetical protein